jgi:hypothetical protein
MDLSIGEWLLAFLLTSIPVIGLIVLLFWVFDVNQKPVKSNCAKAMLIWPALCLVIALLMLLIVLGMNL